MSNQNNNIEQKALEALKNRQIKPSPQAWDRIDAMLTIGEQKEPTKNFSPLKYTASFILLGGLVGFFYWQNVNNQIESNVVKIINDEQKDTLIDETTSRPEIFHNKNILADSKENHSIFNGKTSGLDKKESSDLVDIDTIENLAIDENSNYLTIDAQKLLAEIELDMQKQKSNSKTDLASNSTKIKIDPTQLLDEAEHEMNQSFKAKAIEKINKQLRNLKEAFVKNDE